LGEQARDLRLQSTDGLASIQSLTAPLGYGCLATLLHLRPSQITGTYCGFQSFQPQDSDAAADTLADSGCGCRLENPSSRLWAWHQRDRLVPFDFSRALWQLYPIGQAPWCDGAGGRDESSSSAARLRERNAGTHGRTDILNTTSTSEAGRPVRREGCRRRSGWQEGCGRLTLSWA
jgi:hypothetical protein